MTSVCELNKKEDVDSSTNLLPNSKLDKTSIYFQSSLVSLLFCRFLPGLFKISSIVKHFFVGTFTCRSVLLKADDHGQVPKVLKQRSRLKVVKS